MRVPTRKWNFLVDAAAFLAACSVEHDCYHPYTLERVLTGATIWLNELITNKEVVLTVWGQQPGCILYSFEAWSKVVDTISGPAALETLKILVDLLVRERQAQVMDRRAISYAVFETIVPAIARSASRSLPEHEVTFWNTVSADLIHLLDNDWMTIRALSAPFKNRPYIEVGEE